MYIKYKRIEVAHIFGELKYGHDWKSDRRFKHWQNIFRSFDSLFFFDLRASSYTVNFRGEKYRYKGHCPPPPVKYTYCIFLNELNSVFEF
jgi:hypothetical protein